jgi:hypothetical protein
MAAIPTLICEAIRSHGSIARDGIFQSASDVKAAFVDASFRFFESEDVEVHYDGSNAIITFSPSGIWRRTSAPLLVQVLTSNALFGAVVRKCIVLMCKHLAIFVADGHPIITVSMSMSVSRAFPLSLGIAVFGVDSDENDCIQVIRCSGESPLNVHVGDPYRSQLSVSVLGDSPSPVGAHIKPLWAAHVTGSAVNEADDGHDVVLLLSPSRGFILYTASYVRQHASENDFYHLCEVAALADVALPAVGFPTNLHAVSCPATMATTSIAMKIGSELYLLECGRQTASWSLSSFRSIGACSDFCPVQVGGFTFLAVVSGDGVVNLNYHAHPLCSLTISLPGVSGKAAKNFVSAAGHCGDRISLQHKTGGWLRIRVQFASHIIVKHLWHYSLLRLEAKIAVPVLKAFIRCGMFGQSGRDLRSVGESLALFVTHLTGRHYHSEGISWFENKLDFNSMIPPRLRPPVVSPQPEVDRFVKGAVEILKNEWQGCHVTFENAVSSVRMNWLHLAQEMFIVTLSSIQGSVIDSIARHLLSDDSAPDLKPMHIASAIPVMSHFSASMLHLENTGGNEFDHGGLLEHMVHSKFSRSFADAVSAFSATESSGSGRRKSFESSRSSFLGIQSSSMAQIQSPFPRAPSPLPTSDSPVELTQGYVEDWQHAPGFLTPFPLGRPSFPEQLKHHNEVPSFDNDDVQTPESAIQIIVDGGVTAPLRSLAAPALQYCLNKRCASVRKHPSERSSSAVFQFIDRPDLATPVQPRKMTHPSPSFAAGKQVVDGCQLDDPALQLRFPHDCRLPLVQRLLRSCRAIKIRSLTTAEAEVPDAYQKRLWLISQRTLALPVGRGALTFSSSQPLPTEAMPVPPLLLTAKVPPSDATIKLDLATVSATAEVYTWPEFHNGTAAALRLSPEQTHISRFWIVNHRRPELSNDRWGGFLLGLGLQGHLSVLSRTSYVKILGKNEAYPSVACGLMLGACVSGRGTMNTNLQNLLAPNVSSLSVETRDAKSSVVQNACLVATGLLYEGTYNRLIIDKLVDWITIDGSLCSLGDREASAVSAALGLGYACSGSALQRNSTLLKSRIRDRLCPFVCIGERSASSLSAPAIVLPTRYSGRNGAGMSVVSPAACLALGLCFWNTGDTTVIDCLRLPVEKSRMDFIRPDIALLRVMACALVDWTNVSPTSEWVLSMMPPFLLQFVSGMTTDCPLGEFLPISEKHLRSLYINACVGACLAIGIRYAGSANVQAQEFLLLCLQQMCARRTKLEARPSKSIIYVYETGISVVCMALAMVMAGTGDCRCLGLLSTIRNRVDSDVSYGDHMARNMAIGWLFAGGARVSFSTNLSAVVSLAAASFPVFPRNSCDNRYHLQALRHLYVLAFEHRCLETREVGEDVACCVPVQVTVRRTDGSDSVQMGCTPMLLPPWDSVVKIQLASERYW